MLQVAANADCGCSRLSKGLSVCPKRYSSQNIVDDFENDVKIGDFALIPRWCNHQTVNNSNEELVFLAVADFGLTGKSFVGNYMKTARMKSV